MRGDRSRNARCGTSSFLLLSLLITGNLNSASSLSNVFQSLKNKIPGLGSLLPKNNGPAPTVALPSLDLFSRCSELESDLLAAVSNTGNGKKASYEQKANALRLVNDLETEFAAPDSLFTDPEELKKIDGCWFLQYTSPSDLEGKDEFPDDWKPALKAEEEIQFPDSSEFDQSGAVNAAGIKVDTSNKVVKQIIDIEKMKIANVIDLDIGQLSVGGKIRVSDVSPRRVIVGFSEGMIKLEKLGGVEIDFSVVFSLINLITGTSDSGWLETTYLSDDVRIGRGNKGTMFVLTRASDAVSP